MTTGIANRFYSASVSLSVGGGEWSSGGGRVASSQSRYSFDLIQGHSQRNSRCNRLGALDGRTGLFQQQLGDFVGHAASQRSNLTVGGTNSFLPPQKGRDGGWAN
jgi:hypothetical protein